MPVFVGRGWGEGVVSWGLRFRDSFCYDKFAREHTNCDPSKSVLTYA